MSSTLIVPREIAARMLDQACATCRFGWKDPQGELNCRRNPPTAFLVFTPAGPRISTAFPVVAQDMWCGHWTERGNSRSSPTNG